MGGQVVDSLVDNPFMPALQLPHPTRPRHHSQHWLLCLVLCTGLAGCDALGVETPAKQAAKKEAEAKAIGSACRHALRSIEDCHGSNPKLSKAAVFDGWREMDQYMRENDIPAMPAAKTGTASGSSSAAPGAKADKDEKQSSGKPTAAGNAPPLPGMPPKPNIAPKG